MKALYTTVASLSLLASQIVLAQDVHVGVVNITQAFNDSKFVQTANQKLQTNVKGMEKKVQDQQKKLQDLVTDYEKIKTPSAAKTKLQNEIVTEQKKLNQMTQDFQNKIREEQNTGMQEFTKQVQTAAIKVAKDKKLNAILSSAAIIYMDETWVDVTKDVESAM
jgi:Skp family chaperone for outer membrane proteins